MNVFEKYPQFISTDPRTTRTGSYIISPEFMQLRHECFFNSEDLKDKTVLDLGCCVGASGAWVLENQAKFYCGVEYHPDLANRALDNLSVFENHNWQIINESVETFLENNTQVFDIIIASGIIYAFFEPIPILKNIAKFSNTILIESVHPSTGLNMETESFIFYKRQPMVWGTDREEICFNSAVPSMQFIKDYMNILGFNCDMSINENLKQQLPTVYKKRFAIKLLKTTQELQSQGFISAASFTPDTKIKKWNTV